jgi:hypothetical protein
MIPFAVKRLLWKLRFTRLLRKRTRLNWRLCWQCANAALHDTLNGDFEEATPEDMVDDEIDAMLSDC